MFVQYTSSSFCKTCGKKKKTFICSTGVWKIIVGSGLKFRLLHKSWSEQSAQWKTAFQTDTWIFFKGRREDPQLWSQCVSLSVVDGADKHHHTRWFHSSVVPCQNTALCNSIHDWWKGLYVHVCDEVRRLMSPTPTAGVGGVHMWPISDSFMSVWTVYIYIPWIRRRAVFTGLVFLPGALFLLIVFLRWSLQLRTEVYRRRLH